jgi:hypothetical protein
MKYFDLSSVLGEYDISDVITEGRDEAAEANVPPISGKMAKFLPVSGYYPLGGIGKTGTSPIVTTERTARQIPRSKIIMPQKASLQVFFNFFFISKISFLLPNYTLEKSMAKHKYYRFK